MAGEDGSGDGWFCVNDWQGMKVVGGQTEACGFAQNMPTHVQRAVHSLPIGLLGTVKESHTAFMSPPTEHGK